MWPSGVMSHSRPLLPSSHHSPGASRAALAPISTYSLPAFGVYQWVAAVALSKVRVWDFGSKPVTVPAQQIHLCPPAHHRVAPVQVSASPESAGSRVKGSIL